MATPKEEALRWLEEAEYDNQAARDTATAGRNNWACFISQQAAEKAVKAIYVARGETAERVHSIGALIKGDPGRQVSGVSQLTNLLDAALELDRHYMPTRYPNGVPYGKPYEFYPQSKADECVKLSERIVGACRSIFETM